MEEGGYYHWVAAVSSKAACQLSLLGEHAHRLNVTAREAEMERNPDRRSKGETWYSTRPLKYVLVWSVCALPQTMGVSKASSSVRGTDSVSKGGTPFCKKVMSGEGLANDRGGSWRQKCLQTHFKRPRLYLEHPVVVGAIENDIKVRRVAEWPNDQH